VLCCPNDPDGAKLLREVAGTRVDEAFIGSCMTNIGHFRAAAKLLGGQRDIPTKPWGPPTKMGLPCSQRALSRRSASSRMSRTASKPGGADRNIARICA